MVKLNRIYTGMGDKGQTALGDGAKRPKADQRVAAYGDVDEANAAIGLAIVACTPDAALRPIADALTPVQHDLFDVGADLCVPMAADEPQGGRLRITREQSRRLEALIDEHNAGLAPLESFVLPGGSEAAARLHLARTVVRRAERAVAALLVAENDTTNPETLVYLNRLSDLLFVLARVAAAAAGGDVLWKPGANRSIDGDGGAA